MPALTGIGLNRLGSICASKWHWSKDDIWRKWLFAYERLLLEIKLTNIWRKRGDSIWRFKLESITIENLSVIIFVERRTEYYLKLCFRSFAAIQCMLYSQVTVANVTQQRAVLSMTKILLNMQYRTSIITKKIFYTFPYVSSIRFH